MAFVSRASRAAGAKDNLGATDEAVGPGTYNVDRPRKFRPGYAAFSSKAARSFDLGASSLKTPGPGAYTEDEPISLPKTGKLKPARGGGAASSFVSATSRFQSETDIRKRTGWIPGPGAFSAESIVDKEWTKVKHPFARTPMTAGATTAVRANRKITAPSIPSGQQSFGYEENNRGELIPQGGAKKGYEGRGKSAVGPGSYTPLVDITKGNGSKGAAWSRSRARRSSFSGSKDTANIGPGQYYHEKKEDSKGPKRMSSSFSSAAKRGDIRLQDKQLQDAPGPGAYNTATSSLRVKHARDVPERLQFFGSTSKRAPLHSSNGFVRSRPGASDSARLGPGTYNSATSSFSKPVSVYQSDHGPFNGTAPRFGGKSIQKARDEPGPGAYTTEEKTLAKDVQRKVVGRAGVFGSTSARFSRVGQPPKEDVPGPGAYEGVDPKLPSTNPLNTKVSSSFASRSKRFNKTSSFTPSPGTYDPVILSKEEVMQQQFNQPRPGGRGTFGTTSQRFTTEATLKDAAETPAPGAYEDVSASTLLRKAPTGAAISRDRRFVPPKRDFVPGPGSYDAKDPHADLNKRSFNITVSEGDTANLLF
eukprot:TRINITY_DN16_c0_g1_i1.p1 TRINITY_DN16_c0_g1~~TRINITY_DN16_c0_g1_i1.p1  ORF type:complete len:589 (-),score=118.77 TRINITY_DN16_c0_g1_i1:265-2031(-)